MNETARRSDFRSVWCSIMLVRRMGSDGVVARAVIGAIAANRGIAPERVTLDARLDDDLSIDSLAMIEIGIELEERLGFKAPDAALAEELGLSTVQDLVLLVARELEQQGVRP